jgi:hypothetical protein
MAGFTAEERALVERLIELSPADLQPSLRDAFARLEPGEKCKCGCGTFAIEYPGVTRTQHGLVAEGFIDRPGDAPIGVMLFAVGARPTRLEVYVPERVDGDPPLSLPKAADIQP